MEDQISEIVSPIIDQLWSVWREKYKSVPPGEWSLRTKKLFEDMVVKEGQNRAFEQSPTPSSKILNKPVHQEGSIGQDVRNPSHSSLACEFKLETETDILSSIGKVNHTCREILACLENRVNRRWTFKLTDGDPRSDVDDDNPSQIW